MLCLLSAGLTTAACFAHLGHNVVCTDIDDVLVVAALTRALMRANGKPIVAPTSPPNP